VSASRQESRANIVRTPPLSESQAARLIATRAAGRHHGAMLTKAGKTTCTGSPVNLQ